MLLLFSESVYCEPREVSPYATSEDGSCTRPADWQARQAMPLPPKPDDGPSSTGNGSATTGTSTFRCSPPPPYFPGRPLGPGAQNSGPPPPPRPHSYINDEDADPCYFQPINDEEAHLIGGGGGGGARRPFSANNDGVPASPSAAENDYLIARPSIDMSPTTNDAPGQLIEMRDLGRTPAAGEVDEPPSPLSRQLAVEVIDDAEEEDDIEVVNGRAVLYAIRRPSSIDT